MQENTGCTAGCPCQYTTPGLLLPVISWAYGMWFQQCIVIQGFTESSQNVPPCVYLVCGNYHFSPQPYVRCGFDGPVVLLDAVTYVATSILQ